MIRINPYEIMLLLGPDVPEERHGEIIDRTKETVTQGGGQWLGVDEWGKRKLAYEIGHATEAWYFVLSFDATPEALDEASRVLAITDEVMRFMPVTRPKGRAEGEADGRTAEQATAGRA